MEKIKGKKFIIHRVEPKETLYSISKRYDVEISEIEKYNPSIITGLKMYDELTIPYTKKKKDSTDTDLSESKTSAPQPSNQSSTHIVKTGETLFAISRNYQIPIDSIIRYNHLTSNNIGIGDTLLLKPEKSIKPVPKTAEVNTLPLNTATYHIVQPQETMFGISKQYGVTLDELTTWNQLQSYNLSIGQKLIVASGVPREEKAETKDPLLIPKKKKFALDTIYVKTDNSDIKTKSSVNEAGKTEIKQEGFVMEIEDTDHTSKYLALHKQAAVGTLILVQNQMNGKKVYVRVVGALPETGLNKNVMMRISHAAFVGLGGIDSKIPVLTQYTKE
ncbi:LysM peptidoglycan-binding domain-containing protein [Reichenbachiella agarivorans]|uniref:LysM peptidoglycan-binding domain-containing protein n=1 Tax=Reichenbachiella agarivorans TaxID=2979464 RepID=A0ABY6CNG6_9BACT|nr:LysM peptidoglycan-binding domain-containing protein [Reichenbachiella agarivorans]UXP31304.1 LysM peptidoglycan-binding domain-containing protein [Reichenbachiella agarivorans]